MARHRRNKKDRGLVEIRLGWGSDEEKAHLVAVLRLLRDPAKRPHVINTMIALGEPEQIRSAAAEPLTGAVVDPNEHGRINDAPRNLQSDQPNEAQAAQANRRSDVQSNQASLFEATTVSPSVRQAENPAFKPNGIFFDTFMS